jgi:hypothetical protein
MPGVSLTLTLPVPSVVRGSPENPQNPPDRWEFLGGVRRL